MPPPSVVHPWLAARRFGVVIDAGSSGSRLQIYSWTDPRALADRTPLNTLPKVEKGTLDSEQWSVKVEPGESAPPRPRRRSLHRPLRPQASPRSQTI